jgi:conjugal transfer pilus assembly protein TraE
MDPKKLTGDLQARYGIRLMTLVTLSVLLLSNVFLAFALASRVDNTRVEVKVPDAINKSFWVEKRKVDPAYLEEMGLFVIQHAVNHSPQDAEYKVDALLRFVGDEAYPEMAKTLRANAKIVKDAEATTIFTPRTVFADPNNNTVAFTGMLATYIGDKRTSNLPATYLITFAYRSGRIVLMDVKESDYKDPLQTKQKPESDETANTKQ